VLQPDLLTYYFSLTHELPEIEFKGPGRRGDNPLFGRVVRAAMAMTNRRGGGTIIIGTSEQTTGLTHEGLTTDQLATWKLEDIASGFNSYTSSPIEFERLTHEHEGRTLLVLYIHEFATMPVMCTREYRDKSNPKMSERERPIVLRPGAFYIRTLNKPESKEMLTSEELRMLIDLVSNKAVQSFVTHTKLAGINIAPQPEDEELFNRQLSDWTGPILEEIRSRGHWDVRIRPAIFQPTRLPLSELRQVLIDARVNYRGWELPYVIAGVPEIGTDWISLETQQQNGLQSWRFFQSGQFAAALGFLDDWNEKLPYDRYAEETKGKLLSILDVVFSLTEIFGLAGRLTTSDVYRDERSVVIDLTLHGLQKRQLYGRGIHQISSFSGYTTAAKEITYTVTLPKEEIIANPQELACKTAQYIFERFGWNPSDQLLATMQSELHIHS
jgi:hypothetical protein